MNIYISAFTSRSKSNHQFHRVHMQIAKPLHRNSRVKGMVAASVQVREMVVD